MMHTIAGMPENHKNASATRTALYYHNSVIDLEDTLRAAEPILGPDYQRDSIRYLSSWGQTLKPTTDYRPCGHYLAPLDPSIKRVIILRNSIPLPSSKPFSAVLGTMLSRMGAGSELFIHSPKSLKKSNIWVTSKELSAHLSSCTIEDAPNGKKGWIRIAWSKQIESDIERLESIYPKLASRLDGFYDIMNQSDHQCSGPVEKFTDSIESAFTYSMHWALHTHSVIDKVFEKHDARGPLRIIDIGGSYGFLACELAAAGHHVVNLELIEYRIEQVLPWLIESSGVSGRVKGIAERMENLERHSDNCESYDVVCFMGSLLCIDRDDVSGVLEQASKLLKPGGLIILRENMLLPQNAQTLDGREYRFTAEELHTHLQTINQEVTYLCHLGQFRTYKEAQDLWTIFAAVQKLQNCQMSQEPAGHNSSRESQREIPT